jgi:hypothetical protein
MRRDSSDSMSCGMHYRSSILLRDKGFSSTPQCPDRLWGPPIVLPNGHREFYPSGVKRPVLEADHSPSPSVEVKSVVATLPQRDLHVVVLN